MSKCIITQCPRSRTLVHVRACAPAQYSRERLLRRERERTERRAPFCSPVRTSLTRLPTWGTTVSSSGQSAPERTRPREIHALRAFRALRFARASSRACARARAHSGARSAGASAISPTHRLGSPYPMWRTPLIARISMLASR